MGQVAIALDSGVYLVGDVQELQNLVLIPVVFFVVLLAGRDTLLLQELHESVVHVQQIDAAKDWWVL